MTRVGGHVALLLAAGGSQRLGRPKQLLHRDGIALIRRTALLALATQPRRLVVVLGAQAQAMQHALLGLPLDVVIRAGWSTGMAGSLRAGVQALTGQVDAGVLVLGVDQPALDTAHLFALLAGFDGQRDVVSAYAGVTGIPAMLRAETIARVDELDGDRGFGVLLRHATPAPQAINNESLALDIDTPQALEKAREAGWVDPG